MIEAILFNITFTCIIAIAFNLFVVESSDGLSFETVSALVDISMIVGLSFAYFYFSERITTDLLEICDIFYNALWYRLPARQQKLFMLAIQRGQREVRLTGLGLFDCSMPIFSRVCMHRFFISCSR